MAKNTSVIAGDLSAGGNDVTSLGFASVGASSKVWSPGAATKVLAEGTGDAAITVAAGSSSASGINLGDADDEDVGRLHYDHSLDIMTLKTGADWRLAISSAYVRPYYDNVLSYGDATHRATEIFAATGTINTSDGRAKTPPAPIDDALLDAWADAQIIAFKWLDSVAAKGEAARTHHGVIAQQVRDALEAHGIDGRRYGLLCYDEWPDEIGIDGIVLCPAGNRWGIRADQCLFVEAAYQRRRADRLELRLERLEAAVFDG